MTKKEPILCYVAGPWAYFTTQSLQKQWGDDWDDAPYDCNAGPPYGPCWHRLEKDCWCDICKKDWNKDGNPKWEIIKIAWEGDLEAPCDYANSYFSVRHMNSKCVPWLKTFNDSIDDQDSRIWAGTKLSEFIRLIKKFGGSVYMEVT